MKAKKLEKKLILSKETISNLNENELKKIQGGDVYSSSAVGICYCIYGKCI